MRTPRARRRFAGTLTAAAVAVSMLAACTADSDDDNGGDAGTPSIGVSEINLSLPFFVQMQEASQEIAEDYGVDVQWQSADGSIETQISTIENFVAQGRDVILIDPINADSLVDVIDRATDAGVDVVTMGNKVPAEENHNTLYPDYENWVQQARILGTHLGGEGTVLLLIGAVGNYVSDTRQEAFETTMAEEFPDIEVITQPTDFDSTEASSVTQTVLTEHPDLAGIASISDGLTISALTVVEQRDLDIPFVSNDGDEATFEYIDSGAILSNVLTGSYRVGAWNTAVAARIALGSDLPIDLFMPTYTVASEETVSSLAEEGLDIEAISTDDAVSQATDYLAEFGSDKSDEEMTVG